MTLISFHSFADELSKIAAPLDPEDWEGVHGQLMSTDWRKAPTSKQREAMQIGAKGRQGKERLYSMLSAPEHNAASDQLGGEPKGWESASTAPSMVAPLVGTGLGALAGAGVGSLLGDPLKGALVGGGLGAAGGMGYGVHQAVKKDKELDAAQAAKYVKSRRAHDQGVESHLKGQLGAQGYSAQGRYPSSWDKTSAANDGPAEGLEEIEEMPPHPALTAGKTIGGVALGTGLGVGLGALANKAWKAGAGGKSLPKAVRYGIPALGAASGLGYSALQGATVKKMKEDMAKRKELRDVG